MNQVIKTSEELGMGVKDYQKYILRICWECSQEKWIILKTTKRPTYTGLCRYCDYKSRRGSGNPRWKGGNTVDGRGYIKIFLPDHPLASKYGYVPEHRLVMADKYGIEAIKDMIVHHIDGNKTNNHPDNLMIMDNLEHLHMHLKRWRKNQ